MKRVLTVLSLVVLSSLVTFKVLAACGSYFQSHGDDSFAGGPCPTSFSKTAHLGPFLY